MLHNAAQREAGAFASYVGFDVLICMTSLKKINKKKNCLKSCCEFCDQEYRSVKECVHR